MPKNIVICSDGTGNTAVKDRGTNVFKLFEAVELRAPVNGEDPQIAFYDDGVGTESFKPLKLAGGAVGYGLSRNVRDLYLALARVYNQNDKIFLFGFSRGAYTVRYLTALIVTQGLPVQTDSDQKLKEQARKAFKNFRQLFPRKMYMNRTRDSAGARPDGFQDVDVEFVGVWDTVDAVGFPIDEVADFWDQVVHPFKFPELGLNKKVKAGRHAIAIDDERQTFHPVMWNSTRDKDRKETDHVKQMWFCGAHSNVGGGYPKQGISLVALDWMMKEAEDRGLRFVPTVRQLYRELQNINDKLYNSRSGLANYYRYCPRPIEQICTRADTSPRIHISVIERIAMGTEGYSPGNLPANLEVVWDQKPAIAEQITALLRNKLKSAGLAGATPWVRWRMRAQRTFALTSAAAVGYVILGVPGPSRLEALLGLASLSGITEAAKALAGGAPWLLGGLAVLWGFGVFSNRQIVRIDTEFWSPVRRQLRALLEDTKSKGKGL